MANTAATNALVHIAAVIFPARKSRTRSEAVQQHVDEMMPAGLESEQLAIHHVRNGGERMPVLCVNVGERPGKSRRRDAARYNRLSVDVDIVVVIDKVVPKRLAKNQPRDRYEIYANNNSLTLRFASLFSFMRIQPRLNVRPVAAGASR